MHETSGSGRPDGTGESPRKPFPTGAGSPLYQLGLCMMVAIGMVVLIFGTYEIVERIWFSHLESETLRALHRVRGIFAAMVVGLTVGWIVIRSSPALLAATAVEEDVAPEGVREARIRLYAHWFIAMRWIAVLVAGILVFLGAGIFHILPRETWVPLVTVIGILAACNVLYTLLIRRSSHARPLLVWQAYIDLVILTVLLHFSGGAANPLAVFMLFHVIIGGILLSRGECYRMAAAGTALFAGLAIGEWSGLLAHYPLHLIPGADVTLAASHLPYVTSAIAMHSAALFLVAYFVTTLSERLRRNERRLAALAERALADRKLLEQALETTSTGLRVLTPTLVPEWVNDRWKDWFGNGDGQCRIFPQCPDGNCPAEKCLHKGHMDVYELERPREAALPGGAGGEFYQITSAPIHDTRGEVTRVAQLAHDITAQKEAHARMMRAGQMAAVGELAGQVAHEVNNPIAIISAKAKLLLKNRREEMSPKIAGELQKIVDLSDRVARIAQGLLSYSRPSPTTRAPTDLRLPIRKSISMIEHRVRNREIAIEDNLPDEPIAVIANGPEMEQVFLNLLINAIQATPQGGRLAISLLPANGTVCIAVDDTGPGVLQEIRELVFKPFYTTKEEGAGTGLGLSICQGLVRSHGGQISVEDAPGGGARFLVCLPEGKDAGQASGVKGGTGSPGALSVLQGNGSARPQQSINGNA